MRASRDIKPSIMPPDKKPQSDPLKNGRLQNSNLAGAVLLTLLLTLLQACVWLVCMQADLNGQTTHDRFDGSPPAGHSAGTASLSPVTPPLDGLAFSAYGRWDKPDTHPSVKPDDKTLINQESSLSNDLLTLRHLTRHIRTYSALEWKPLPALAQSHDMRITLGIWLSDSASRNQAEIDTAIQIARKSASHANLQALIVGNETQLQNRVSLSHLIDALATVRQSVPQPVSTAEPWHVWLAHPELADHVDFITIHLLPYWEGIPVEQAVDYVFDRYRQVQQRFPDKMIVIGETGWPSGGPDRGKAVANPQAQAYFLRTFLDRIDDLNPLPKSANAGQNQQPLSHAIPAHDLPRYFLMEAIDQPWKVTIEGEAGAYWGLLNAGRQLKFEVAKWLYGRHLPVPQESAPLGYWQTLLACLIAATLCITLLSKLGYLHLRARLTVAAVMQCIGAGLALMLTQPLSHYLTPTSLTVWALMLIPTALMALVLIAQTLEFADTFWDGQLRFSAQTKPLLEPLTQPLVSIHVACCNEPPQMVIATLQSLLDLRWNNLQIVIVDNNTTDPACWTPVRDFLVDMLARQLAIGNASGRSSTSAATSGTTSEKDGSYDLQLTLPHCSVHFRHEARLAGYKAGALNLALELTHPDAAWVAVVDADYVVARDWIASVGGYFAQDDIDIIQAPQTHRMTDNSTLQHMMSAEYDTFFRIGMHHRHERNAIIQHGTMTLIRAATLRKLNGWNTDCICEDTELGLRILATGARALYIDQAMGAGLLPADSQAYLRQRYRWACGAMQIMRTHAELIASGQSRCDKPTAPAKSPDTQTRIFQAGNDVKRPRRESLTLAQRYHFVAGWLPWWGDTLHLFMTLAALLWSAGMLTAPNQFGAPMPLFMLAPLALLAFRMIAGPALYRKRIGGGLMQWGGAALAGMALSHTIAKGVLRGLLAKRAAFVVTPKTHLSTNTNGAQAISGGKSVDKLADHAGHKPRDIERSGPLTGLLRLLMQQEVLLLCSLLGVATLLQMRPPPVSGDSGSQSAWLLMLVLQAFPYAATTLLYVVDYNELQSREDATTQL